MPSQDDDALLTTLGAWPRLAEFRLSAQAVLTRLNELRRHGYP